MHRGVLGQESDRAGAQGLHPQRVLVVHREHEHLGVTGRGVDATRRLDAVEHRHRDVHHDDVGTQQRHESDRFLTVAGFGDDVEAGVFERAAKRLAQQLMVVGDQDAGHCATSRSTRTVVPHLRFADQRDVRADGIRTFADADEAVALARHDIGVHAAPVVSNFELCPSITTILQLIHAWEASACRSTFVSDSWRMRQSSCSTWTGTRRPPGAGRKLGFDARAASTSG